MFSTFSLFPFFFPFAYQYFPSFPPLFSRLIQLVSFKSVLSTCRFESSKDNKC